MSVSRSPNWILAGEQIGEWLRDECGRLSTNSSMVPMLGEENTQKNQSTTKLGEGSLEGVVLGEQSEEYHTEVPVT